MFDAAMSALGAIFAWEALLFLLLGTIAGLAIGVVPGMGGVTALAILLPFTLTWEPAHAFSMMVGILAVNNTSDDIPAILFGVPGSSGAQAIVLDGFPMAQRGEAGRALGAGFTSAVMGGVIGAIGLGFAIPILRPMILAFGSPEFFMMGLLGISMVAVLSGKAPVRGLIAGALGLLLGVIGQDPQTGVPRWTFGQVYLMGGISIVPIALGLFAIPEMTDLLIKGTSVADKASRAVRGTAEGVKDSFRHWFLVLRCSIIGVWLGAIPGIGNSVVDWFAYGHARQTEKGAAETFGRGDVRGVIAPDSCVNAKDGGALIPTLAFGIPGSSSLALLLAAMVSTGLQPGPDMLTVHLDVTYTMVWSLALANIIGTLICLALARRIALLSRVNIYFIAPMVLSIVFLAAYQATRHWGDLWVMLGAAVLGWTMKRCRWPRPPLLLGLVLAPILESYLWISTRIYGPFGWTTRPIVMIVAVLIVASVSYGIVSERRSRKRLLATDPEQDQEVVPS